MKSTIGMKLKPLILILTMSLLSSGLVEASDPDLSIYPVIAQFPQTNLGASSATKTFQIQNTSAASFNITAVTLTGTDASQFFIDANYCAPLTYTLNQTKDCTIEVSYRPTTVGSKMAMLQVATNTSNTPNLRAILSNDEGKAEQAQRRLPPVLFDLTIPEIMDKSTAYTLEWSVLGYDEDYEVEIVMFDCLGKSAGTCGANYAEKFFQTALMSSGSTPEPAWVFNDMQAKKFDYSYSFKPEANGFLQSTSGSYEIVVRFYIKSPMDTLSGVPNTSLMVPGNLTSTYYDDEGRRITKHIVIP